MFDLPCRWAISMILVSTSFFLTPPAVSATADHRKGLDIDVRGGVNQCIKDDESTCKDLYIGGGFGAMMGIRFLPFVSVGVDVGLYMFGQEEIETVHLMNTVLELRIYFPHEHFDIYGKFGGGYMRLTGREWPMRSSMSSWANMKWGGGVTFFVLKEHRIGDVGLGLNVDYLWTNFKESELCSNVQCQTGELDKRGAGIDAIQYSVHMAWIFPIMNL